jgi:hypothetical protein
MAKEIHQYIETSYDIKLPLKTFIWGNMKPDFKKDKKLHYIDNSLKETTNMFKILNNNNFDNIKDYTLKLGEFFHYVTDYFCYAHSIDFFKDNLSEHFIYEFKAHKKVSKFKKFYDNQNLNNNILINGNGNLVDFLLFNHEKYLKSWKKTENDFIYSLKLAPTLIDNIIPNNKILIGVS